MSQSQKKPSEKIVKEIRRKTHRNFSAEEKIRIVIEDLRGDDSIATICRRKGIHPNLYYGWSRDFIEAGKKRLQGDTQREANSDEASRLKRENTDLKIFVSELSLDNRRYKKTLRSSV